MMIISPGIFSFEPLAIKCAKSPSGYLSINTNNFQSLAAINRKKFSISLAFKRDLLTDGWIYARWSGNSSDQSFRVRIVSDQLEFWVIAASGDCRLVTNQLFDDTDYHHAHCIFDSDNATADDRIRMEVDGSAISSFAVRNNPGLSTEMRLLNTNDPGVNIGGENIGGGAFGSFDGKIFYPAFFNGTIPANATLYSGGLPLRPSGAGLHSLLECPGGNITRDSVLSAAWSNSGAVTSDDTPS